MAKDGMAIRDEIISKAGKNLGENLVLMGEFHGILRDENGKVLKEQRVKNQVQTYMLYHCADQLSDQGDDAMSHMAVGDSTGQGIADTALASQIGVRYALDSGTPLSTQAVVAYHRLFAAGEGTGTITEAGIFNHLSAGNMGLYNDSITFTKGALDTLEISWTLTFARA